jgi:hypothetical protein
MRDDLVGQYKQKLEAALGDDEKFTAIYNDLRTNIAPWASPKSLLWPRRWREAARARKTLR